MNLLAHFFLDCDMRCSHEGLLAMIKKKKITIKEGEFIVFMNRRRSMIKMFCGHKGALMHWRDGNKQVDPGIIRYLPKYCGGNELDVTGAVKEHLEKMLKKKGYKVKDE